jgi:hypothetical protein
MEITASIPQTGRPYGAFGEDIIFIPVGEPHGMIHKNLL